MPAIKDTAAIAAKWARVTPGSVGDYTAGVQSPRTDWARAAAGADANYKTAVTAAANAGRYARGVTAAGTGKWQQATLDKGPGRFAEGVSMGAPAYQTGFGPYADVIRNTNLPPRFPAGSPQNIQRVSALAAALNMKKTGSQK